jgi:hypothetical protein
LVEISRSKKLLDYAGIDIIAFLQDGQNAKVQVSSLLNTCKISADTGQPAIGTLFFESSATHSVVSSICFACVCPVPLPEPACSEHWQLPIAMAGVNNNREWGRCPLQHRLLLLSDKTPVRSSSEVLDGW